MGQQLPHLEKDTLPTIGKRTFNSNFILAQVSQPILGAEFFCSEGLLIDCQGKHLVDAYNYTSHKDHVASTGVNKSINGLHGVIISSTSQSGFADILNEFVSLTQPRFSTSDNKHDVQHYIVTSGPRAHAKAWRLFPAKLAAARCKFARIEDLRIVADHQVAGHHLSIWSPTRNQETGNFMVTIGN